MRTPQTAHPPAGSATVMETSLRPRACWRYLSLKEWLCFGAEVKVGVLRLLSRQRVIPDEQTKRIVHTQLQHILKLAVGLACRRYLDEVDHGCAQCSVLGEADTVMQPNSVTIELGNAFEGVVAPGMAIAGQIAGGAKNAEDRRPRLGAQRFAKVIQKRHS